MENEVVTKVCEAKDCNVVHPISDMTELSDGGYVCEDCYADKVHRCRECQGYFLESEMVDTSERGWLCAHCEDQLTCLPPYAEQEEMAL